MSNASQPLVSIVTPVYNGAEYLAECVESILAQTYQNWDYTIVDNCSTDGSADIARRYAAKDKRIRIVENQQFVRAIANHNIALRQISPASKYCKVVFGDDWIFPECLERMVAVAEEHPSVAIVGAYGLEGERVMWGGLPYPSALVPGRVLCRRLFLEGLYVFGTASSLLYRSDFVRARDPFYNESNLHADVEACLVLLKTADFAFVHQVLTFTRLRPDSLRSLSSDLHTYIAGELHDLVTHGSDFLTPAEFSICLNEKLSAYYDILAGGVLRRREKRFWDYHKHALAEAGIAFSRMRLATVLLAKCGSAILNPKLTVEKLTQVVHDIINHHSSAALAVGSQELKHR
jgi:glycosyltransferase involved in cell wall biosynthesis